MEYPSAGRAWYAIVIFYLAYTLAFLDRQILAFLVGPIRADFHVTDFQFSLIQGLAFVIFYSVLGIPIARLADVRNRRNIIALGVGLWSVMTAVCGLAGGYWQLFLARLGVGVGEASLSPAVISVIADTFPAHRRALPISLYSAGVHGGAGTASIFGGLIVTYALSRGWHGLPFVGDLRGWQVAFMLVGLPGVLVVLLTLTVREPARRWQTAPRKSAFRDVFIYLGLHGRVYATLMVGAALAALASYGAFGWVPALFARRFGWSAARIGLDFGLITIVIGTGGLLLGGAIASRMARNGRAAPYSKVMIVSMAAAILPSAALVLIRDPYWTLGCLALMVGFMSTPIGLVQAALQAITPNQLRAQVIAVYLLTVTLIGTAIGPAAVAALTVYYYHDDAAVGASIAVVTTAASLLSVLVLLLGVGAYARKVERPDV